MLCNAGASAYGQPTATSDADARVSPTTQDEEPRASEISLELRVNRSIARGIAWIEDQQREDGWFGDQDGRHGGGRTALGALTLLRAGLPRDRISIVAALHALEAVEWRTTYSASVYLMLCEALQSTGSTRPVPAAARACCDFLVEHQVEGVWAYPDGAADMSNTQFALLGLRSARRLGLEVPARTLERAAESVLRWQSASGSVAYLADATPTGGMTVATLGGFQVLTELGKGLALVEGALRKRRADVARAEAWFEGHFTVERNAFGDFMWTASHQYAYLWAIERWCGLSGQTKIGELDWYRAGAEWLVSDQRKDGDFGTFEDTCFALLFLRRATVTGWRDLGALYAEVDVTKERELASKSVPTPVAEAPRLTQWLVAGPFRDAPQNPAFRAWNGTGARVSARERSKLDGKAWEAHALNADDWTDLEVLTKREVNNVYWALATRLDVLPREATVEDSGGSNELDVCLWFTFEDAWRIWLDGQELARSERSASPIEECLRLPIQLSVGAHQLFVLLAEDVNVSAIGVRVTNPDGSAPSARLVIPAAKPDAKKKSEKRR